MIKNGVDLRGAHRGEFVATGGDGEADVRLAGPAAGGAAGAFDEGVDAEPLVACEPEQLGEGNLVADASVDGHGGLKGCRG
jgi:hypothetical protein